MLSNKTLKDVEIRFIKLINVILILTILSSIYNSMSVIALPSGPVITYNQTQNYTPTPASQITTYGGSFTTLLLNATTQTMRWKAYVGNVSGKLILQDASAKSIYDWKVTSVTGEVYSTRNNSVDWSSIACANQTTMETEDYSLNMTLTDPDTINKTFANKIHKAFYVGTILIANSTCPAISTYVNSTSQISSENASFQEILLKDSSSRMVYATLINQNTTGFNNQKYDFQMIVAENEWQTVPTTYYMYVELI